ncbi:MAG: M20 family metallopeptidase [Ruminococcaceae bacterium]|nr:M20 family metallopeptidase [Oscillospiraceae bacterium]
MEHTALFEKIDELTPEYINVWEDVCNIESPTDCKDGVDKVGNYFADLARAHGWEVEIFEHNIAGNVVCITMNADSERAPICLSGHIDTVHPIGLFGSPAVHIENGKIYGPGVLDCKGGVVASFLAMDALDRIGFKDRPVMLLLQSDEEKGSSISKQATINYICEKAKNALAFLNTEPASRGEATLQRKGIIRYRLTVHGISGHSAVCYENSANAILEAAHKIIELEKMKDPAGLTCNCGVISGGTVANTVPNLCVFQADIRFANQSELEKAKETVASIAANSTVKGCTCEVEQISFRPAMEKSEKNYRLLDRLNEINRKVGLEERVARSSNGGSDAAYATVYGIPCVDNLGTRGGKIHSPQEYAHLDSLAYSAKELAAALLYI